MKLLESVLQQNKGTNEKEEDVTQESRDAAQGRSAGNGQISAERRFNHPRLTCPDGSPGTMTFRRSTSKEKVII